jgi:hypothetical protein
MSGNCQWMSLFDVARKAHYLLAKAIHRRFLFSFVLDRTFISKARNIYLQCVVAYILSASFLLPK